MSRQRSVSGIVFGERRIGVDVRSIARRHILDRRVVTIDTTRVVAHGPQRRFVDDLITQRPRTVNALVNAKLPQCRWFLRGRRRRGEEHRRFADPARAVEGWIFWVAGHVIARRYVSTRCGLYRVTHESITLNLKKTIEIC